MRKNPCNPDCMFYIFLFSDNLSSNAAEDDHSIQLHEASLVTEAKKADVMKATMSRTASF